MVLDDWLPRSDFTSRHEVDVPAPIERVWDALDRADFSRPLVVRLLMGLRRFGTRPSRGPLLGLPFTLLADEPGRERLYGLQGRFWTLTGGVTRGGPERFREPPPVGLATACWNFHLTATETGTRLATETRIRCGDPVSRRLFGRYWWVIRPGSGLIRRAILAEIRRVAMEETGVSTRP